MSRKWARARALNFFSSAGNATAQSYMRRGYLDLNPKKMRFVPTASYKSCVQRRRSDRCGEMLFATVVLHHLLLRKSREEKTKEWAAAGLKTLTAR
jgi:hypothetical protein